MKKSIRIVGLLAGLLFSGLFASALSPHTAYAAVTFPAEGAQVMSEKGDVSYWSEQCLNGGTKTDAPVDPSGKLTHDSCSLPGTNGTMVCHFSGPRGTFKPIDDCVITYSATGHIRTISPNFIAGAKDVLTDKDGKTITVADGGVNGQKDATGQTVATPGNSGSCGVADFGCQLMKLPGILIAFIALLLLGLSGLILAMAGTVFNWVIIRTVYQFGTYFGTSDGMLTAWGIVRDIANIGLLFGFIFMGVLLILNVEGGGHGHGGGISAKKAIPRLILFAVLLNFSLFASQAIIDVANAFSSTFATLAGQQCDAQTTTATGNGQATEDCANNGISGQIMQVTGMSGIFTTKFSTAGETIKNGASNIGNQPYSYSIMLICLTIFVLITAMVLLAGAIMLAIRVVVLSLLMVTSPIGFAGLAIPKLSGIAGEWWNRLLSQAFFAPVYLLLIFISLKLSEGLMDGDASIAAALMGNQGTTAAGNMQVIMVFMVVIGFMIASLITASKMGAMGASFAMGAAHGAVSYPLGILGRETIGRGGAALGEKIDSSIGRARNSNNKLVRLVAKSPLANIAGDFAGSTLGAAQKTNFGTPARSFADNKKFREERDKHIGHATESAELGHELSSALALPAGQHRDDEVASILQKMNTHDLEETKYLKNMSEGIDDMARNMSPEQFRSLMNSKEVGEEKKAALKAMRFAKADQEVAAQADIMAKNPKAGTPEQQAAHTAAKDKIKETLSQFTTKDLENAPPEFLGREEVQKNLSGGVREDLVKGGNIDRGVARKLRALDPVEQVKAAYATAGGANADAAAAIITGEKMTPEKVAKLPEAILTTAPVMSVLNASMLGKLQRDGTLSDNAMTTIAAHLRAKNGRADAFAYIEREANKMFWP